MISLLDTRISFTSFMPHCLLRSQSKGRCATNSYFQIIAKIHDIESYLPIDNGLSLNVQIFLCHWGHLAIIFMWVSGNLFHIGWNGNYELWLLNPIARIIPIAHGIWDPHLHSGLSGEPSFSGIYNWLYTLGFTNLFQLYNLVIVCELLAVISLLLAKLHLIYNEELLCWLGKNKPLGFNPPPFEQTLCFDKMKIQSIAAYFDLAGL